MSFFLKSVGIGWQMFPGFWFASRIIFLENGSDCCKALQHRRQNWLPRAMGVLADEGLLNWALNSVHENSILCFPLGDFYRLANGSRSGGLTWDFFWSTGLVFWDDKHRMRCFRVISSCVCSSYPSKRLPRFSSISDTEVGEDRALQMVDVAAVLLPCSSFACCKGHWRCWFGLLHGPGSAESFRRCLFLNMPYSPSSWCVLGP